MKILIVTAAMLLGAASAWAAQGPAKDPSGRDMPIMDGPIPGVVAPTKPLAELKGVVSWKTLAEVQTVKQKDKFVPQFSSTIANLDKKEVKLQGFMMPLDTGDRQKRFILTAMPPSCAFCLPSGPDQLVEVQAKTPVKYSFEPIVLSGRLTVLKDDPMGLFYRLTDAVLVSQ